MVRDSILFYYYSMPELPENCYLQLNPEIAYRNMLMFPSSDVIHFELPVFEDHSYNTICNRDGLKALIKLPSEEKYIIFQTYSIKNKKKYIIGYYKVGREFYYKTKMWDNYGYVWGIESFQVHLLKKDDFEYLGQSIPRTPPRSWSSNDRWRSILDGLIEDISSMPNIAALYQSETERLVNLFKNPTKLQEWRDQCSHCGNHNCTFFNRNRNYRNENPGSDLISVIQHTYSSNLYSRNILQELDKQYLRPRVG
jgi:hypothetical protein